jgi:hypothetical protein
MTPKHRAHKFMGTVYCQQMLAITIVPVALDTPLTLEALLCCFLCTDQRLKQQQQTQGKPDAVVGGTP